MGSFRVSFEGGLSEKERRQLNRLIRYSLSETCSEEQLLLVATILGVCDALPERHQSVVRRRSAYITGVVEAMMSLFKSV